MTSPRTPTRSELTVIPVPGPGAEDVLVAEDGTVYTPWAARLAWSGCLTDACSSAMPTADCSPST